MWGATWAKTGYIILECREHKAMVLIKITSMITIQSYVARSFIVTILPSCWNDFFLNQEIVDFSQYQMIKNWFIRKKRWKKINECNLCLYYFIEIWLVGQNSWIYQQMAHLWPNQVTRIASNFQKDMRKEGNKMIFHLNTIFLKNNKQTNDFIFIFAYFIC